MKKIIDVPKVLNDFKVLRERCEMFLLKSEKSSEPITTIHLLNNDDVIPFPTWKTYLNGKQILRCYFESEIDCDGGLDTEFRDIPLDSFLIEPIDAAVKFHKDRENEFLQIAVLKDKKMLKANREKFRARTDAAEYKIFLKVQRKLKKKAKKKGLNAGGRKLKRS